LLLSLVLSHILLLRLYFWSVSLFGIPNSCVDNVDNDNYSPNIYTQHTDKVQTEVGKCCSPAAEWGRFSISWTCWRRSPDTWRRASSLLVYDEKLQVWIFRIHALMSVLVSIVNLCAIDVQNQRNSYLYI